MRGDYADVVCEVFAVPKRSVHPSRGSGRDVLKAVHQSLFEIPNPSAVPLSSE